MTQEEKAKRYDEAIEIAKEINNEQRAQPFNVMTRVFPELKESEDERIRKAQLDYWRSVGGKEWHGVPVQEVIAWLEKKQGEQKPWSEEDEETLKDIITSMTNLKDSATSDALRDIYNSKIDWLKSLKPNHWKPSDKQMRVLANACDGKILNLDYLNSLYQDLKKLREE